jgi:predicted O-methyltransferase YrrM
VQESVVVNSVLEQILQTRTVTDGQSSYPLIDEMDRSEGALIDRVFRTVQPDISLEIGCAYGVSALYACDAIRAGGKPGRHIILDPMQGSHYRGIGLRNLQAAGYADLVELHEARSELMLPELLSRGLVIQAAIIDGMHTFDHALVDLFYVNKMLAVGGMVILDDVHMPALKRLMRHVLSYPAYELFMTNRDVRKAGVRQVARRALSALVPNTKFGWDVVTCVALRKTAEDERPWNWHADF